MEPKFYQWLHELTLAGYTKKIILHRSDARIIEGYYLDKKTPDEALALYIEFKAAREEAKAKK